jgi:hypothetical protein
MSNQTACLGPLPAHSPVPLIFLAQAAYATYHLSVHAPPTVTLTDPCRISPTKVLVAKREQGKFSKPDERRDDDQHPLLLEEAYR